jgi:NAD(P)-dependent dehydrogenase (short-subunit alcohol dehydrogenase family)
LEGCGGLRGVRVLVTGASRGIGFYAALELAKRGARVALSARRVEGLKRAAREIASVAGWEPPIIPADLTRGEDLERLLGEAWRRLGGLDALVFNAGNISCEPCMLHEAGYSDWMEAARLHLVAPGYLATLFVRRLLEEGRGGIIVFLSSVTVKAPMRFFALADASRAGLVQLARHIARHYGDRGVRAYTVLLGSFDTPGARRNVERIAERLGIPRGEAWEKLVLDLTPLRRTARPEELGALLEYLLSPEAEYMNGATLTLDGAMTPCV